MDFYHRSALILDSLDAKKGSVKGLCMTEAKKSRKQGEASRFLKVIVEVLKYRPHLLHLLEKTKLLTEEPKLFIAPVWADPAPVKMGSAASVSKALKAESNNKTPKKTRPVPTPLALATVMVHDLVFAKRGLTLPKEHKVRKKLDKYKEAMDKETARQRKVKKVSSNEGLQIALPETVATAIESIGKGKKRENQEMTEDDGFTKVRWLRVNTITWSVEEAVEWFESERWEFCDDVESMLERSAEKNKVFTLDAHIEPLLALPVGVSLPSLLPYQDSRLIAQDKASCMPPWILLSHVLAEQDEEDELAKDETNEEKEVRKGKRRGVKVLDATASPGNKTTFASAMAGETGLVFAVERDQGRYKVLKEMCKKAGCENVTPMNADFLAIDPQDNKFKNVSHFLVDPSCSGSGIPSRLDHLLPLTPEEEQKTRIRALSNFQLTILSHAMRFRGARRVVYSTCSVWAEEDEGVVMRLLKKKEFQEKGWRLAGRDEVIPTWNRRGRVEECDGDETIADSLVRCLPEDGTNGFFVACFIRVVPEGEEEMEDAEPVTEELSHAERQHLFKQKKQTGSKGGPKGVIPSPKKEVVEPKKEKAAPVKAEKKAVPGKKAAYLLEKALLKKRKMEGEMRSQQGKKTKQ